MDHLGDNHPALEWQSAIARVVGMLKEWEWCASAARPTW